MGISVCWCMVCRCMDECTCVDDCEYAFVNIGGCTYVYMYRCRYVFRYVCMYVRMYICMCVCVGVHVGE